MYSILAHRSKELSRRKEQSIDSTTSSKKKFLSVTCRSKLLPT